MEKLNSSNEARYSQGQEKRTPTNINVVGKNEAAAMGVDRDAMGDGP